MADALCQDRPTVGGTFDIGFAGPDGKLAFAFEGAFTEVDPPSRLAYVIGDGRPVTITLTELGAKRTRMELILTLETRTARNGSARAGPRCSSTSTRISTRSPKAPSSSWTVHEPPP